LVHSLQAQDAAGASTAVSLDQIDGNRVVAGPLDEIEDAVNSISKRNGWNERGHRVGHEKNAVGTTKLAKYQVESVLVGANLIIVNVVGGKIEVTGSTCNSLDLAL